MPKATTRKRSGSNGRTRRSFVSRDVSSDTRPEPQVPIRHRLPAASDLYGAELTPLLIKSILSSSAAGEPYDLVRIFDEMIRTDQHLAGVLQTRKLGVTGHDWEISTKPGGDSVASEKIEASMQRSLDMVRDVLDDLGLVFDDALNFLADAPANGIAVVEVVWGRARGRFAPVNLIPIPMAALRSDPLDSRRMAIVTELSPIAAGDKRQVSDLWITGAEVENQTTAHPDTFVVFEPMALDGFRTFKNGLKRGAIAAWLKKRYANLWWLSGIEKFGVPFLFGELPPGGDAKDRDALEEIIDSLGTRRGFIGTPGMKVEAIQSNAGGGQSGQWPHERLIAMANREYEVAILGQTLTTSPGQQGSRALGEVHERVREDILKHDRKNEAAMIRDQLLAPMVRWALGPNAPVPYFRRVVHKHMTRLDTANVLDIAVNKLGALVPNRVVAEMLALPLTADVDLDAPLEGASAGGGGLGFPFSDRAIPTETWSVNRTRTPDVRRELREWAESLAAFVSSSKGAVTRTINKLVDALEKLGDRPTTDDLQRTIVNVIPDLTDDDLAGATETLVVAGWLAGREVARLRIGARNFKR